MAETSIDRPGDQDGRGGRDRPIIFSAPMITALLAGRKTQHRVVLKLPPKQFEHPQMGGWEPTVIGGSGCFRIGRGGERIPVPETVGIWHRTSGYCAEAPHQAGDRLWVKEAFRIGIDADAGDALDPYLNPDRFVLYSPGGLRDQDYIVPTNYQPPRTAERKPYTHFPGTAEAWTELGTISPRFMPRWASRLTLIVEAVKVERLADISDADARAEGFESFGPDIACPYQDGPTGDAADAFAAYWDSLHGKGAFEASPWVAALTFRAIPRNIDSLGDRP